MPCPTKKFSDYCENVLKFLQLKSFDCEINNTITFKNKSGNNVDYDCYSSDKNEFVNLVYTFWVPHKWKYFHIAYQKTQP